MWSVAWTRPLARNSVQTKGSNPPPAVTKKRISVANTVPPTNECSVDLQEQHDVSGTTSAKHMMASALVSSGPQ